MSDTQFSLNLTPRFCETDALGHINNTVIPVWFEAARDPVFDIVNPGQDLTKWNMIIAGFNIVFNAPTFYGTDVTVKTHISRVGNSSFEIAQSCWQNGRQTAEAKTTMVHYNYQTEKSQPISGEVKAQLAALTGE
ncbi:1,4-dihydroxy-2-naphthoyl-CoA hydrolase [Shewanella sp. P1-14-1]|uniref:acyl-CoA thioesterase n=1 Tax=Shewanella sp. P1-14-1 TaxID=1723761 RepID=UPI0006D66562|nr:thioesterase family protein [Shewanella sp. P1-14-1]KPZ71310.1 1,4-dihydroxy-2-naphthoyl-CoA hydrolase [Shewanella sp. P1-14-1]